MTVSEVPVASKKTGWLAKACRDQVLEQMAKITWGTLAVTIDGKTQHFGTEAADEPTATLVVHDNQFFVELAMKDDIGAGSSYAEQMIDTDDLETLCRIMLHDPELLDGITGLGAKVVRKTYLTTHALRRNSKSQAKKNIAAHYDLGNAFFERWLDSRMMYSSGIYLSKEATLEDAQLEKIDRICRKLRMQPGQTVMEIGSGWGGFAMHAAKNYGVHVTTTTISEEQFAYATEAVKKAGLEDKVKVIKQDYRDLTGQFDYVVSIEMIEAVGHQYFDSYFGKISELLKPTGEAVIQAILMRDERYDEYVKDSDFIRHYIFPGGCLPSIGAIHTSLGKVSDLKMHHLEDIGPHYGRTLMEWHENMHRERDNLPEKNQDPWFFRLWDFYLCCCAALFTEQRIGVSQLHYTKPMARPEPVLMEQLS